MIQLYKKYKKTYPSPAEVLPDDPSWALLAAANSLPISPPPVGPRVSRIMRGPLGKSLLLVDSFWFELCPRSLIPRDLNGKPGNSVSGLLVAVVEGCR